MLFTAVFVRAAGGFILVFVFVVMMMFVLMFQGVWSEKIYEHFCETLSLKVTNPSKKIEEEL